MDGTKQALGRVEVSRQRAMDRCERIMILTECFNAALMRLLAFSISFRNGIDVGG